VVVLCWSCFARLLLAESVLELLVLPVPCWNYLALEVPAWQLQLLAERVLVPVEAEAVLQSLQHQARQGLSGSGSGSQPGH